MVEISKYHYVGIFIFKCAFISCTMASNISVMENVFLNALGTQTLTTLVTIPKSSKFNYNKMCLLGNATYSQLLHCVNSQVRYFHFCLCMNLTYWIVIFGILK